MTTGNGVPVQAPLYVRALRLRQLRVGGFVSFLLFECMIAIGVLLALAELVSWWAVPILPAAVALMVKVNDVVAGPRRRRRAAADRDGTTRANLAAILGDERSGGTGRRTSADRGRGDERSGGADRPRTAEPARTGGGRGGTGSPGQGRPTHQPGSDERPDSTGDGSKGGDTPQRRHVGVIRIAVPPRDGGVGQRAAQQAPPGRTVNETTGRHARVQRTGGSGRYADDGYVSNGRHSDGGRHGDEEITRQRGTFNQGRFA